MLDGFDILCIGSADWTTHKNVPQQTMGRLAGSNRVLYVNLQQSPVRALRGARGGYGERQQAALMEVQGDAGKLWLYSPPPIFLPEYRLPSPLAVTAGAINGTVFAALIARTMKCIGFNRPLLWIFGIGGAGLLGKLGNRLVVYDCIDEWAGFFEPGRTRDNVSRNDEALCRGSDLVFVTSRTLLERRSPLNANTHLVSPAADFPHFRKAGLDETPLPSEMAALPRPVIGLAGMLDGRVDLAILDRLATAHPEWTVALVGPVWDNLDVSRLRARPNVRLLGGKTVEELPGYIRGFDVCIVPYVIDDFTRNIFPLKLYEYLASGKPIVATRVPAIAEHADLVRIADEPDGFVRAAEAAVAERDAELGRRRVSLASENTWEHRVETKSRLVLERLSGTAHPAGPPRPAKAAKRA